MAAALASEESLRIAAGEVRKAELRSKRYLLYLTPDVRATGAWTNTGAEETDDGSGPKSGESWAWSFSLTQPLFTGGRATAAYRGQKDLEASVRLQAELTGRELALAAAGAWYELLAVAESVRIGEQGLALARRQLERAARRVELGVCSGPVTATDLTPDPERFRGGLAHCPGAGAEDRGHRDRDRPGDPLHAFVPVPRTGDR